MAKEVTVLGIEGGFLHGVRLEERNGAYERTAAESWPLEAAQSDAPPEGGDASEVALPGDDSDGKAVETVVEEDKPLARAIKAAAEFFGQNEFALSLPLSKLLVKGFGVPVEAREDLLGPAALALDEISPFPDEALTPAAEIVAEDDAKLQILASALPAAAAAEYGAALDAAHVFVTHTDATALGWLRGLWPRLCEVEAKRRLVLLYFGGEWELAVVDGGAPVQLRGIGKVASVAELCREVTLSLLSCEGDAQDVGDVAVCCMEAPAQEVLERLATFGPVRVVAVDDAALGVEGCARRMIEGGTFDVTPADWVESRTESRFRRKMKLFLSVAAGVWLLVVGVLFGYELAFNYMRDGQKALRKERRHAKAYKEVLDMTNRVALIDRYEDRSKCALEMLKLVSDSMADDDSMTIDQFRFRRGEDVFVRGKAPNRDSWRQLDEDLRAARVPSPSGEAEDDEERPQLFAEVKPTDGSQNRDGLFPFTIEAKFPASEEEGAGGGK
ncbi:MAG: hypothetical protein II649_01750 [Kiritimatiellae bacterium]|nr:hypothetical protein [Kiritimatiellia bacterium]